MGATTISVVFLVYLDLDFYSVSPWSIGSGGGGDIDEIVGRGKGKREEGKSGQGGSESKEYSGAAGHGGGMGCCHLSASEAFFSSETVYIFLINFQ